uniref:NADH dehydrogenase [ubiquinone] 1 alpha subcomplex subunit 11 n=1 Tax=Lygus hesperus TaxID=30085 RepID=A0A0A9YBF5_LYGHE
MGLLAMAFGENYRYHDTPDGEDCFDKLFFVTKYAACYGILWSSVDVTLYSHPVGYGPTLTRYAYLTVPIVAVSAAWTGAVCTATNIRKKDDQLNYAIGGVAAGSVIGAWRKSLKVGCYSSLALALVSALYKDSMVNNWNWLNNKRKPIWNNLWSIDRDWTITDDPPKSWTTGTS